MFWRVNITGEWHGRFEYDDPAAAPYAESFVWQITHERSGRVSGDCTDSVTGQRAELLGRIDRRQLEILKQYPTDPSVLLGTASPRSTPSNSSKNTPRAFPGSSTRAALFGVREWKVSGSSQPSSSGLDA